MKEETRSLILSTPDGNPKAAAQERTYRDRQNGLSAQGEIASLARTLAIYMSLMLVSTFSFAACSHTTYTDWCSSEMVSQPLGEWDIGEPIFISCGDIDENGYQDLVVTSLITHGFEGWESCLSVIFRDASQDLALVELGRVSGDGSVYDYPFGLLGYVCSPTIVDLDGDGHLDVIAFCQTESTSLSQISTTANVWWGGGTSTFGLSSESFVSGPLAETQACILSLSVDAGSSLLLPSMSTGEILRLDASSTRALHIESFLEDALPMAPMSLMSCNLSEDGVIDIAVAGFVPTSSSKIQRALMILHSERAYTLDDESAFFLFSSEESAVSPISMSNIDMDGDGHAEILATRRLDQTPEEGVLPWASNEEVVLIASDDVAWRKLDTQILWELPGSGTSIVGAIQPDSEDSQIILALPDLRIEILTIHAGKVRSTCYIPQDQLRGSCLMNEADAWQLIYASEAAATKTRIYMRSHE